MEARETDDGPPASTPHRPAAGPPWRLQPNETRPPSRPTSLDRAQLGFEPQKATRWFSPGVLTATGLHEGVTSVFGSFLDKRELQVSKPCEPDLRYAGHDEIWLDYVADTGDGFEATATVACQVAKRELHVAGLDRTLPRGDVLVLGGDEVYPSASTEGYESRLEGPWRAALAWTDPAPTEPAHPTVYAIPGNHDWYDGLTGFLRQFGQGRWIGGWHTHQTRSYFAVKLPHGWWLWGIDIQADALVDEPQLEFFSRVARQATPGDRLVLATAVPAWTRLERDPLAYRNLAYIERTLLRPAGIELELTVAGDAHHYARYLHAGDDAIGPTHKITAGGGGAFLHPTHDLPRTVPLGVSPDDPDDVTTYDLVTRYPSRARSRLLSLGALLLPLRNPSFAVVPGLVSVAFLWTIQFGLRSLEGGDASFAEAGARWGWTDLAGGIFRNSGSAVMLMVLFGGLWAFARTPPWAARGLPRWAVKTVMAAAHLALQVVTVATVCLAAVTVAATFDGWRFTLVASLVAAALGGVACSVAVGAYLAAAIGLPGLRAHANESFAASRLTSYKNFLRMHIDRDGDLTVYAVGIDRAVKLRHWRAVPEAESREAAWIEPATGEPRVHLIDTVEIRRVAPS